MTPCDSPFRNRLRKQWAHRRRWARRTGITAFRVYDRDMPEYPYVVEWWAGRVLAVEHARRGGAETAGAREEVLAAIEDVLEVAAADVVTKTREPRPWGRAQYVRLAESDERFVVEENGLRFWVDVSARIDTGLFLDHRNTRARVKSEAAGKRFLNLFSYTGAFTVHAAAGGAATTTSVDLSNTYLAWTEENLTLNGLAGSRNELLRSDVTRWVHQVPGRRWDLIVLDPPPFSVSKKMAESFEVQRDHVRLLRETLYLLERGGVLYFSTSFRGFRLDSEALPGWRFDELTPRSIPEDVRDRRVHRCWRVSADAQ